MGNGDEPSLAELDEVLGRAVERQIAEQRALRTALEELRDAVRSLVAKGAGPIELDVGLIDDKLSRVIESGVARMEGELRDVRHALDPQIDITANMNQTVRSLREDLTSIKDTVGGVGADVEGIAQAIIDLNGGLRVWADDVEASVEILKHTVDGLRDLTGTRAVAVAAEQEGGQPVVGSGRLERVEDQLKETAELSLYLTDQIEDLDGVLKRLGDLPEKVEGVVTQALRRTLTASKKLEKETSTVIDDVGTSLQDNVERLAGLVQGLDTSELRKLKLGQIELASQVATLHETLSARIDEVSSEHRRTFEALARVIDRWAGGSDPRALDAIAKAQDPKPRSARAQSSAAAKKKRPTPRPRLGSSDPEG